MSDYEPIDRPPDHPLVDLEVLEGPVGVLRLVDVDRRNALRIELSLDIESAMVRALGLGCRAIIVTAAPPVFCSGGDLDDLVAPRASLSDIARGAEAIRASSVPTIAAIDGAVIGAGMNLVLACDVILCTPGSIFDPRLLDLGVHPGGGQLRALAGRVGRQGTVALSLLGDRVTGTEAAAAGLAWRCLPQADLLDTALELARRVASRPAEAMRRAKVALDQTIGADHETAVRVELANQQWSIEQPWIPERVAELRERLQNRSTD